MAEYEAQWQVGVAVVQGEVAWGETCSVPGSENPDSMQIVVVFGAQTRLGLHLEAQSGSWPPKGNPQLVVVNTPSALYRKPSPGFL